MTHVLAVKADKERLSTLLPAEGRLWKGHTNTAQPAATQAMLHDLAAHCAKRKAEQAAATRTASLMGDDQAECPIRNMVRELRLKQHAAERPRSPQAYSEMVQKTLHAACAAAPCSWQGSADHTKRKATTATQQGTAWRPSRSWRESSRAQPCGHTQLQPQHDRPQQQHDRPCPKHSRCQNRRRRSRRLDSCARSTCTAARHTASGDGPTAGTGTGGTAASAPRVARAGAACAAAAAWC